MTPQRMSIPAAVRETITALHNGGASHEALISRMRSDGLQKLQSIRLLSDVAQIQLGQAKKEVHLSSVWADRRATDDAFHDSVLEAVDGLRPVRRDHSRERIAG